MTLNLLANILMVVFMVITVIFGLLIFFSDLLSSSSDSLFNISVVIGLLSAGLVLVFIFVASCTNVRVEHEPIPIVKVTDSHYAIRKNGGLEYYKLPATYQTTSGKSRIEKTKAIDWYFLSKNQVGKSKVYIHNK